MRTVLNLDIYLEIVKYLANADSAADLLSFIHSCRTIYSSCCHILLREDRPTILKTTTNVESLYAFLFSSEFTRPLECLRSLRVHSFEPQSTKMICRIIAHAPQLRKIGFTYLSDGFVRELLAQGQPLHALEELEFDSESLPVVAQIIGKLRPLFRLPFKTVSAEWMTESSSLVSVIEVLPDTVTTLAVTGGGFHWTIPTKPSYTIRNLYLRQNGAGPVPVQELITLFPHLHSLAIYFHDYSGYWSHTRCHNMESQHTLDRKQLHTLRGNLSALYCLALKADVDTLVVDLDLHPSRKRREPHLQNHMMSSIIDDTLPANVVVRSQVEEHRLYSDKEDFSNLVAPLNLDTKLKSVRLDIVIWCTSTKPIHSELSLAEQHVLSLPERMKTSGFVSSTIRQLPLEAIRLRIFVSPNLVFDERRPFDSKSLAQTVGSGFPTLLNIAIHAGDDETFWGIIREGGQAVARLLSRGRQIEALEREMFRTRS